MEAYIDGNGNLLPSFYEASRWDIVKTFGLTIIDCMFFFATSGVAIYLAFWKSLFVIAYHTIVGYNVYPKSSSIISEEETYPENTSATDISTESDFQQDEADKFNEEETAGQDISTESNFQQDEADKFNEEETAGQV